MIEAAISDSGARPHGGMAAGILSSRASVGADPVEQLEHLYPISPSLRRMVVLSQGLDERDVRRLVRNSPSVMAKVVGESRRVGLGDVPLEQLLSLKSVPQEILRSALNGALAFRSRYEPCTNERMHQNVWMRAILRARCVRELSRLARCNGVEANVAALVAMCADLGYQVANVLYAGAARMPEGSVGPAHGQTPLAWDTAYPGPGGATHSELAARLLASWDVDSLVVRAIASHHQPQAAPVHAKPYAMAVRFANALIWNIPGIYEEQDFQEDFDALVPADWAFFGLDPAMEGTLTNQMRDFAIWLRSQSVDVLPLARRRLDTPARLSGQPGDSARPAKAAARRMPTSMTADALALAAVPTLTPCCSALSDLARLEVMDRGQVAHAIESSPSMTAYLVGKANSLWHRQQGYEILGVQEAMSVVGEKALRAMLFDFARANERYARATAGQMTGCSTYWMHATAMAFAAREIARKLPESLGVSAREIELLAYVHGIGQSAVASLDPDALAASMAAAGAATATSRPPDHPQRGAASIDALGAVLCRKWGLPETICAALEGFRNPETMPVSHAQTLAYCLLVAKALVIDAAIPYPEPLALRPVRRFTDRELAALGLERTALLEIRNAIQQIGEALLARYAALLH
jgi:HD-like signal output (HDOD) protein